MNDREKLIEEAAAKRYPHRDVFLEGGAYMAEERSRIPLREAFVEGAKWQAEKAHTPTDDERQAQERIEAALDYIDKHWLAPFRPGETGHDLRSILAAGFRRSVVREPSAEKDIEFHASAESEEWMIAIAGASQRDIDAAQRENELQGWEKYRIITVGPKPQVDPSDAQVTYLRSEIENALHLIRVGEPWVAYEALRAASAVGSES